MPSWKSSGFLKILNSDQQKLGKSIPSSINVKTLHLFILFIQLTNNLFHMHTLQPLQFIPVAASSFPQDQFDPSLLHRCVAVLVGA